VTTATTAAPVWLDSTAELDGSRWAELTRAADIEHDPGYLGYLESEDPDGRALLVLPDDRGGYAAACALSRLSAGTPRSSRAIDLITDPARIWLPADANTLPAELAAVLTRHTGSAPTDLDPGLRHARRTLNEVVGVPLAVRSMWDSSLLVAPELSGKQRRRAMAGLLTGLLREALRRGHRSVAFLYAPAGDRDLDRVLTAAGFVAGTVRGNNRIRLDGCRTVEDYLRRFNRRHRSTVRRDVRTAAAEVERLDHGDPAVVERVVALEHANSLRYGRPVSVPALRLVHERLATAVPARVRQYGVMREGRLVASLLALLGEHKVCCLTYGVDYDQVGEASGLYGPVVCHRPVADALAAGLSAVDLGPDAHEPKLLRGARLLELRTYVWSATPEGTAFARDWLSAVDARTRAVFDRLRDRYAGRDTTPADGTEVAS
jgi:predicted N-acyltransferase